MQSIDLENESGLIEDLITDHEKFDNFVYFKDLDSATKELHRRRSDESLMKKVEEFLSDVGIPEPFKKEPRLTIFRQVATPNIEVSRFLIAADGSGMNPLFLEYYDDKFTSNNECKWYLGKLAFYHGQGKNGGAKMEYYSAIDFNQYDGKKISEVKTKWDEPLKDFHHKLFDINYKHLSADHFFDGSNWFKKNGGTPNKYYLGVLTLMILNGILMENFLLSKKDENDFCKNVFLPAFIKIFNNFGVKPIVVALSPTTIENEEFWLSHNIKTHVALGEELGFKIRYD